MAHKIKVLSTIVSCGFCAGMIACSKLDAPTGVYVCIAGCFVSFLVNMVATAKQNQKILEDALKQEPKP